MKQFRFNMEKVLELRRYEERRWEMKLGEVTGKCVTVNRRIKEYTETREKVFSQRRITSESAFYDFKLADRYIIRLEKEKEKLSHELQEYEQEREEIKKRYLEASRKRKVIEKLKERKQEQYYRQQRKEEQKEIDDITASRRTGDVESFEKAGKV
ncbi:MAG: flagellar export protein FliJ [Spirochaetaceae bacterium]